MSWPVFSTVNVCYNQSTSSDTLLLSKVQSLFRFLSFYLMCFLRAGISSRTLHTMSCHVSLGASRLWQFLCLVLLLMILKVLRSTSHTYCRIALYGICLILFLLSNWDSGLGGGREMMGGRCPLHHIMFIWYMIDVIYEYGHGPGSLGWGPACQVSVWRSYPLFLIVFFGRKSLCTARA